jgi:hypothetical protein
MGDMVLRAGRWDTVSVGRYIRDCFFKGKCQFGLRAWWALGQGI